MLNCELSVHEMLSTIKFMAPAMACKGAVYDRLCVYVAITETPTVTSSEVVD